MRGVNLCLVATIVVLLCVVAAPSQSQATLIQLPNRGAWEEAVADLSLRTVTEDFDSVPIQIFPPYTTSQVGLVRMTLLESEITDIRGDTDRFLFSLFSDGVVFEFPSPVFAFAADLGELREEGEIEIRVLDELFFATGITDSPGPLPDFHFFIGVVSDTPIRSFSFESFAYGFGMDNLSFAPVPEPGAALMFGVGSLVVCSTVRRRRS